MGIMTDKQFEEFLRNTAQDYNRPPENTPHTEIWAEIDEARHGSWQREQWREATPWWSFGRGIAATVALWLFPLTAVAGGAALAINHWTGDSGSEFTVLATEHGDEHEQHAECNDVETRVAALNALLQMETEQAMPILMDVLERRDACSVELRRKAVFLVSQHETRETVDILMRAVREDPDHEVQEQAVFWLGQTSGDDAVTALESILQGSEDIELQKKVVFSLSQHGSSRAGRILRDVALDSRAHEEVREQAIFWLGQEGDIDASELRELYNDAAEFELKEHVIFVLSQFDDGDAVDELMDIARNETNADLRDKAIFWLGQSDDERAAEFLAELINRPTR
jgi:HEAT repeat protein